VLTYWNCSGYPWKWHFGALLGDVLQTPCSLLLVLGSRSPNSKQWISASDNKMHILQTAPRNRATWRLRVNAITTNAAFVRQGFPSTHNPNTSSTYQQIESCYMALHQASKDPLSPHPIVRLSWFASLSRSLNLPATRATIASSQT